MVPPLWAAVPELGHPLTERIFLISTLEQPKPISDHHLILDHTPAPDSCDNFFPAAFVRENTPKRSRDPPARPPDVFLPQEHRIWIFTGACSGFSTLKLPDAAEAAPRGQPPLEAEWFVFMEPSQCLGSAPCPCSLLSCSQQGLGPCCWSPPSPPPGRGFWELPFLLISITQLAPYCSNLGTNCNFIWSFKQMGKCSKPRAVIELNININTELNGALDY